MRTSLIKWTGNHLLANLVFATAAICAVIGLYLAFRALRGRSDYPRLMAPLTTMAILVVNPRLPYYSNPMVGIPLFSFFSDLKLTPLSVGLFLLVGAALPGMHPWLLTIPLFALSLLAVLRRASSPVAPELQTGFNSPDRK